MELLGGSGSFLGSKSRERERIKKRQSFSFSFFFLGVLGRQNGESIWDLLNLLQRTHTF